MTEATRTWTALTLERGDLTLTLLPGLGGRLWNVSLGGRSLLFQNPDLVGRPVDLDRLDTLPSRSPQFGFPLWGGEKTWIAPDRDWPNGAPHPVLDSGPYRVTERTACTAEMASTPCTLCELQVTRRVMITAPRCFTIEHRVRNLGKAPRLTGIWSVMMIDRPATIAVAGDAPEVRPVFGAAEDRLTPAPHGAICRCDDQIEFKLALSNPGGRSFIRCAGAGGWMLCDTRPPDPDARFAHGLPFEVFNSVDYPYCEAEWHSASQVLLPGAEMEFSQDFRLWQGDDPPDDLTLTPQERELLTCMC